MRPNRQWSLFLVTGLVAVLPLRGQSSIAVSCASQAAAGGNVVCSLVLTLAPAATVDSLTFGLAVAPSGNAPALSTGQLSFTDLVGGGFVTTGGTNNAISVLWYSISPPLSGTVQLGSISFAVPAGAASAQSYGAAVTGGSASVAGGAVSVSASSTATTAVTSFGLCDLNQDGQVTVADEQRAINEVLGVSPPTHNLNGSSGINAVDVQIVANALLGLGCSAS